MVRDSKDCKKKRPYKSHHQDPGGQHSVQSHYLNILHKQAAHTGEWCSLYSIQNGDFLYHGVETWVAIGGWAMNDPGIYSTVFSELAASTAAQEAFFDSLLIFLDKYKFDGVDIDWYGPV